MTNFTVVAPDGADTHGTNDLLCLPPQWSDYLVFFLTNYAAHAATVIAEPGQSTIETIYWTLTALFLPAAGLVRTLPFLFRRPGFEKDPLKRAALSGALCTVVRIKDDLPYRHGTDRKTMMGFRKQLSLAATRMWSKKPKLKYGYEVQDPGKLWTGLFEDVSNIQSWINVYESKTGLQVPRFATKVFSRLGRSMETKVAGLCHVPEGFQLIVIPAGTPLRMLQERPSDMSESEWREMASERDLPCSYSVPKLLISLVQALYAISTLYQARGNQIEIYGYAAFGLTVAPYVIMSAINVATNVVTPDYPCMYLVAGPDLREAERCGGVFDNIVAEIDLGQRVFPVPTFMNKYTHVAASCGRWGNVWVGIVLATLIGLPLAVVGGLSRFQANASTPAQRGWTMAWLATSMAMSFFVGRVSTYGPEVATRLLFYSLFYAPAIGGMVVVGLQLREYGICSSLDNVSIA